MLPLELDRGQVVQAAVRAHGVVVVPSGLDHDLGFGARAEPLQAQALVAELAIEALVVGVLPWLARVDQRRGDAALGDPLEDRAADELRPVVRTQEQRRAVHADESGQNLDDAPGADRTGHVDGQALAGELVDHLQALDLLARGRGVEDEVVGPDAVWATGWQRSWT